MFTVGPFPPQELNDLQLYLYYNFSNSELNFPLISRAVQLKVTWLYLIFSLRKKELQNDSVSDPPCFFTITPPTSDSGENQATGYFNGAVKCGLFNDIIQNRLVCKM